MNKLENVSQTKKSFYLNPIQKGLNISSKKLRIGFWIFCTTSWLLLYWVDNESFAAFFGFLNIFTFLLLTTLITESSIFIHRKVKRKTNSTLGILLSSIAGIGIGIVLTIIVCIAFFWGLMFLIYS